MTYKIRNSVYDIIDGMENLGILLMAAIEEEEDYRDGVENLACAAEKQDYATEVIGRMDNALSALREAINSLEAIEEGE